MNNLSYTIIVSWTSWAILVSFSSSTDFKLIVDSIFEQNLKIDLIFEQKVRIESIVRTRIIDRIESFEQENRDRIEAISLTDLIVFKLFYWYMLDMRRYDYMILVRTNLLLKFDIVVELNCKKFKKRISKWKLYIVKTRS